ncbi:MAG: hypothetical protein IAG13_29315, partial [Deltaproteobacteria bacterium]|nr:hypothetical protein [Nannocystaceae bacterium]
DAVPPADVGTEAGTGSAGGTSTESASVVPGSTTIARPWTSSTAPPKPKPVPSEAAIARDSTVPPDPTAQRFRERWKRPGSKQRFAFEFKIGPYLPEVDKQYEGSGFGPYAKIFGQTNSMGETVKKPRLGVMPAFAFEWQFVYLAGPLALGTQVSMFFDRADALLADPAAGENIRSSADTTRFGMVPLSLMLIYRFELLADFYKVPLVPYAKVGLAYAFWWIKDGTGKVAQNEAGKKGRGGVVGWQLNPGVMLRLDFIEPSASKKLDQSTGINHAYIFGEFQLTRLRNFGFGNSIDLGDKTFLGGLAIEF